MPNWAIINTILLFAPVVAGIGVFFLWYVPNSAMRLPALLALALYYIVVFSICQKTSGHRVRFVDFYMPSKSWPERLATWLGLAPFSLVAYCGFYVTCGAVITQAVGVDAKKDVTVVSFYDPYQKHCDYKLVLKELSPVTGRGFCLDHVSNTAELKKGSKITLYGRRSLLGFRFTEIGG